MKGLNPKLRQNILLSNDLPTTIREWYEVASRYNNNWRQAQALNKWLTGGYDSKRKGLNFKSSPRPYVSNLNTMDMRPDKLSTEQYAEHMKKGLCFRCHQPGHTDLMNVNKGHPTQDPHHETTLTHPQNI